MYFPQKDIKEYCIYKKNHLLDIMGIKNLIVKI